MFSHFHIFYFLYITFTFFFYLLFLFLFFFFLGVERGGFDISSASEKKGYTHISHSIFIRFRDSGRMRLNSYIFTYEDELCIVALITPLPLTARKIYESGCVCFCVTLNCSEREREMVNRMEVKILISKFIFCCPK